MQKCAECRYFLRKSAVLSDPGECRANPPSVSLMGGTGGKLVPVSAWPPVQPTEGCGAGKPRTDPVQVFNVPASAIMNN